jgi:hypothetical protein
MFDYRICGLTVSSQIELTGAIRTARPDNLADVSIRCSPVPQKLNGGAEIGPNWELAPDQFLLRVPGLARFLVTGGRDIAVELEPDAQERDAIGFVLGTAFGILLHQRGALVLHGSAVERDGKAIAICGPSGAGKSTLAAALCREGYSFATDDLCVIGLDERRLPIVFPDGRRLKLWKQTIDKLDLGNRRGEAVRGQFEKYYIDPFGSVTIPPRLTAIYLLRDSPPTIEKPIEALALPDAMRALEIESYRPALLERMGHRPTMLAHAAMVLGHAKSFVFNRQRGFEHMPATIAKLRTHWDSLDRPRSA